VQQFPTAKLLLNNKDIVAREIRPTLYSLDGQTMEIAPVIVEANSFRMINLSDWANIGGENFRRGSIKLFHTGKDLNIGSQIYLSDEANSLSFEERLTELGKFDSRRLESIWAMPGGQTQVRVILSNTSDTLLSVTAKLSRLPQISGEPQTFTLLPHQTRVFNLRTDFNNGETFANAAIVGLTLEHNGAGSALKAHGQIRDSAIGYSNIISFTNPGSGKSSELHGTGLHVGTMGNEQVAPVVAVKNVGATTATVTARVPYTRNNGTTGVVNLPSINLLAGEFRLLNTSVVVSRSQQESIKIAGIEIEYSTAPGSVIVSAQSVSTSRTQVFRVPMADPLAQVSSTGGYPWRIEETSRTVAYIKNMTDLEQEYLAFLTWENGGEYAIGLKKIAAHKTIEIDVKKIRDEQTPDFRNRTIPLNLTSGQIKWTLRQTYQTNNLKNDRFALVGRSEQIDTVNGISSSYACQNCCSGGDTSAFITNDIAPTCIPGKNGCPIPVYEFEAGETVQYYSFIVHRDCYGSEDFCSGYTNNWSSNDTNIAIVNSNGLVTIQNAGAVRINATVAGYISIEGFPCQPGPLLTEACEEQTKKEASKKESKEENAPSAIPCDQCGAIPTHPVAESNISARKLEILRNGQPIAVSGQTPVTQNVIVGEKIDLTTRVTGGTSTQSNHQWTIPGTRIANYAVTYTNSSSPSSGVLTELTNQNLAQPSIQFYWTDGADARNVQYFVKVNNKPYTAIAKFNVKRPTVTVASNTHLTTIYTASQHQELLFGEISRFGRSTFGITFTRNDFQVPTNFAGDTVWVQVIDYAYTRTLTDGQTMQTASAVGLDSIFPYSANDPNATLTRDLPAVCLRVCSETTSMIKMQTRIDANMWLMFKPSGTNSI
jgi:hypothetical protein